MKNLVGILALAASACAAPLSARAASGDIISIHPVDPPNYAQAASSGYTAESPMAEGADVCFAMRVVKRNATDGDWAMTHIGSGSEIVDDLLSRFNVGIYVSGELRYAEYVTEVPGSAYTDFIFKYTVKPGDFAMPVVLAVGQDGPQPANASKLRDTAYHVFPAALSKWAIRSTTAAGAEQDATLSFKTSESVTNADYDLRGAGFYVQTLDFEDDDAWRAMPAGTTLTGVLHLDNAPTNTATFYVWSEDESVVKVQGAKTLNVHTNATLVATRSAAVITLVAGQQDYTFRFAADADATGRSTTLVLSGFDDFNYNYLTNERRDDYLQATVTVTDPPEPYMSLVNPETGKGKVTVNATTNTDVYTEMRLRFSKAYGKDVNVVLAQKVGDREVPEEEDYLTGRYLSVLTDPDGDPILRACEGTATNPLTMPAGETELKLYVFGLGSATNLTGGLTLVPTVAETQPTGTTKAEVDAFFLPGQKRLTPCLVTLTDQVPSVSVTAPSGGFKNETVSIDVTVSDNWRDLQAAFNTNGYRVAIQMGDKTVLNTNGIHFAEGESQSFSVKIPSAGSPLKCAVLVYDETHRNSAGQAAFEIEAESARAATAEFYPDTTGESTKISDGFYYPEGTTVYVRVSLTAKVSENMWAFLVPQNEAASNLVECTAMKTGLRISGSQSTFAPLTFLDGYSRKEPMRALFKIDLRDNEKLDAEGSRSLGSTYDLETFELTCVNASPTVSKVEMNGTKVNDGGSARAPVGVEVKFRATLKDASPVDLAATNDQAIVTRWRFTDGTADRPFETICLVTNENGKATCPFTFSYDGVAQTVTVWARDKDDRTESADLEDEDWGDPLYSFTVNVAESPHVIVSQDEAGTVDEFEVYESADRKDGGFFYVQLSDLPTGAADGSLPISKTNPLVVELVASALEGSDGHMALATNRVYFTNSGDSRQKVYFDLNSLNGGYETDYEVTARVITSSCSNEYGQAWSEYYTSGQADVTVLNVEPSIDQVKRTNGTSFMTIDEGTNTCSAGEVVKMHWKVSDVLPDVTNGNMTVEWSISASSDSPTAKSQTITNGWKYVTTRRKTAVEGDYYFTVPDAAGTTKVKMTVDDGDGGASSLEWLIYVEPTKRIKVNVLGPAKTSETKYGAAAGLGQGFVAATGTAVVPRSEQFVQSWDYADAASSAELFAWGYPSKATWDSYVTADSAYYGKYVDNGTLPAALDSTATGVALTGRGNTWTAGAYYDWSTMGGRDATAGDYDSFFYRWMVVDAASDSKSGSGGASAQSNPDAAPTYHPLDTTQKSFKLGTNDEDASADTVKVEAVFSRELYPKDNLGDINADGIPDRVVMHFGINAETGKMPDDDLTDISALNDDEDYLPNFAGSTYSTLIPGLPSSWTDGKKFTALLEIRGYHEGLNNAAELFTPAMKDVRLEADYHSDDVEKRKAARDYSELEMIAWSLTGYDKNWTPECPSNPTIDDTDNDGFTDGYEYYFWYRAHVGDLEHFAKTGEYRKLTGRRYDPKNPGEGTVITSETIEKLMNPRLAYGDGESANLVDTDNDGLPDLLEYELGTNPFDFDTDGDGLPDGWEIMIAGLDPLTAQSYTDGLSDTVRNTDGDAMAISSYLLEQKELPVPVNYDHARRWTFAVIDANGDTDGVQWYAMTGEPKVSESATYSGGYQVSAVVDGAAVTFFSESEPGTVTEGGVKRLKADTTLRTLVEYKPDGTTAVKALGYPYALPAGSRVTVTETADEVKAYVVATAVDAADANACWIYGRGTARTRLGEVADSAADYGCLALARQKAVPADATVVALPSDERDVAFLHFLCYQEFGFDPRTAWSAENPLHKRWGKVTNGEAESGVYVVDRGGYTGAPARTREYANYDEFLVCSFFWNNEGGQPPCETYVSADAPEWAQLWGALTTNPQGPNDAEKTSSEHYYGRSSTNGADTDGDGVPDGWELYVMAGPKTAKGAYVFAPPYGGFTPGPIDGTDDEMAKSYFSPFVASAKSSDTSNQIWVGGQDKSDGLNQFQEFEGTDTMLHYADYSTTVVHDGTWKWLNKFFPTDPWSPDTDGDGVKDGEERDAFAYTESEYDDAKHGALRVIPGGGLNPNSVDTDLDGLPDGWEKQFAGKTVYEKDGTRDESKGYVDGMDGTVSDAYTKPGDVNRDYDNDGLENWQEYLTGTMRCWRYDDPVSPLTYLSSDLYCTVDPSTSNLVFDAETAAKNLYAAGLLESEDVGEFWYKTLVDATSAAYNPHLVMDEGSGAQYLSRVTNVWDAAYLDYTLGKEKTTGAYYWFYDRVNENLLKDTWGAAWEALVGKEALATLNYVPTKYVSCSPIDPDTDHDGMDDYYEVFHGMNPILGKSGLVKDAGAFDVIYDATYKENKVTPKAWGETESTKNFWQRKVADSSWTGKTPRGNGYDFEVYPWLNGLADADPDGDGIVNQTEAIMPLVSPTAAWYHTDPTPLWMTDSSYTNSIVRMNYRMPYRAGTVALKEETFTYNGETFLFSDFDGFLKGSAGTSDSFAVFNPDAWKVVGIRNTNAWIASFEQNEGFDTDHDGLNDNDEVAGKYRTKTDPLDADSPRRRQAMYFQGPERPSILQTMPFEREYHPLVQRSGRYPDDMAFLQYTVECWVKAESLDDSTVIERAVLVGRASPDDREYVRANFRLGIRDGKWYTAYDPNETTRTTVEAIGAVPATTEWTHLAATYDATKLTLYVNGKAVGYVNSGLQPAYGASDVAVNTVSSGGVSGAFLGGRDCAYHAIIVGASAKTTADGASGLALDVTQGVGFSAYKDFFKGYVDEIRVWDGARTAEEIASAKMSRFTAEDAQSNRESFFAEWSKGGASDAYRGRYAKDGSGNAYPLPAELRFHWAFDSLFGASEEGAVAKVPAGFNYEGEDADGNGARALRSRPEGYGIAWWQNVLAGYANTVYDDPAWICWVPNTVAHLPRYDGTTLDSRYWSEDYKGDEAGAYKFARSAEPVSVWTQYRRGGVKVDDAEYFAAGSRHHFAADYDAATSNSANFVTLYEFTGRHLNQAGDDMLALGGAFAKHVDDLWDSQGASSNWEVAGADGDGDGLPDWWERLAEDAYRDDAVTGGGDIGWTTTVRWPDQNGTLMPAWEAYLRDLARGYHGDKDDNPVTDDAAIAKHRQTYDSNGNGLPDWWESLYGLEGESGLDDHDNDGLPNYVEYLLSEVFSKFGVKFDPTRADSVQEGVPDYFYRVGDLYVGEIFTDHDLVDDSWEDLYSDSYASRSVYDPYADADGDGWSNRSEARYAKQSMPIVADEQSHYAAADGLVADYPIPTIALSVNYAGQRRAAVEKAPLVVELYTDADLNRGADATYNVGAVTAQAGSTGTGTSSTGGSTQAASEGTAYTRTIGKWSNRHAVGTLTPGYVNKNSLTLEFCYDPSSETYSWQVRHYDGNRSTKYYYEDKRGTRAEYDADKRKYGDANIELLSRGTEYTTLADLEVRSDANSKTATWIHTPSGRELGTIDLTTGAFDLNLGIFKDQYVSNATNASDYVSLEDQSFRIAYSANEAVGIPRKLYLGQADSGHVREGKNTVIVFADLDNSGTYTAGEPYGCVTDVDVSWKGTSVDLMLTDTTPVFARVDPIQGLDDRSALYGTESGNYTNFVSASQPSGGTYNRVRVVRHMVIGSQGNAAVQNIGAGVNRVLFDQMVATGVNPWITEANFLASGALDVDWDTLYDDIISRIGSDGRIQSSASSSVYYAIGDVRAVVYRIVIGNESIDPGGVTSNMSKVMPVRWFDSSRQLPIPVSSGSGNGVVKLGRPTFKWRMPNDSNGYTAFKVSITSVSGASFSWTSDYLRMPAADADGVYTWAAPVYVGDRPAGATGVFANNATYTWSVSASNAKFKPDSFVTGGTFRMGVQTNGYDIGAIATSVRYYGPAAVTNDANALIRVRAYTSPDFTGEPVSGGFVDKTVADGGVNCRILGLPKGDYYLQAFVDSNGNGVWDKWESMGYSCTRDGSTADYLDPVAVTVGDSVGANETVTIYVEDADTDCDNLPDAWEYVTATAAQRANGTFLSAKGVDRLSLSGAGELAIDAVLTSNLLFEVNRANVPTAGLASGVRDAFLSSASFASLAMGLPKTLTLDAATGTLSLSPTVTDGTLVISGLAYDAAAGAVELTVTGEVTQPDPVSSSVYRVTAGSTVTVKVLHTATLAGEWQTVATKTVTVSGDSLESGVITVPVDVSSTGGFYKVEIDQ